MRNVFIIGDLHLKCTNIISRKDDYPNAILKKLEFLCTVAKDYKCNQFIILGDVFDSPSTSLPYLANVINTFKKINESGITVYTIVGNHDIKNNRIDSLETTALGILLSTNYVKLAPKELQIENTLFKCFNYTDEITPKKSNKYEVCLAHRYYEFALDSYSLYEQDVKKLNYDAMVLGHLHAPCDNEQICNTILYRPGSLARNSSEPFNKVRIPRVLVYNCNKNIGTYLEVACSAGNEIFIEKSDKNNNQSISMKDLINFITTSYTSSDMNVRDYFNSLKLPLEYKLKISKYLDNIGA